MIPQMEPPIVSAETVRLDFPEPLSPEDSLLIRLLAERYAGKDGTPFMTFSRDGTTSLICPKAIRMVLPYADSFTAETESAVRLSDNGGGRDGNSN